MKPSKRFEQFLSTTSNWKFRTKMKEIVEDIADESDWLKARLNDANYAEADFLVRKIYARSKLLDSLIIKQKRNLK